MKRLLIILGLLFFGLTNNAVIACSCIGNSTVEGVYNGSNTKIIISGQVIAIERLWVVDSAEYKEWIREGIAAAVLDTSQYYYSWYRHLRNKVSIRIEHIYKGQINSDTLTIWTGIGGGDCGFPFKKNEKYIVYGYFDNKYQEKYDTDICTRTKEYDECEASELEKLKNKNIKK